MLKAWRVEWGGIVGFVAAETRGKARAACKNSAEDAGYHPDWRAITVHRSPDRDIWAASANPGLCVAPWYFDTLEGRVKNGKGAL